MQMLGKCLTPHHAQPQQAICAGFAVDPLPGSQELVAGFRKALPGALRQPCSLQVAPCAPAAPQFTNDALCLGFHAFTFCGLPAHDSVSSSPSLSRMGRNFSS